MNITGKEVFINLINFYISQWFLEFKKSYLIKFFIIKFNFLALILLIVDVVQMKTPIIQFYSQVDFGISQVLSMYKSLNNNK